MLTGTKSSQDGHLGYYNNTVTAIPEGDDYELFGWNKPIFNKISATRAFTFSWLQPNKKYDLTTNTNGEHRAFVVTGQYEKVFPLDIFPMQLLKACMVRDLDEMEQLGLYEVAPEDFSLTEFICISKQPHQEIFVKDWIYYKRNRIKWGLKEKLHNFKEKNKDKKWLPIFSGFHTFLYSPNETTHNGTHVKGADDLKRTMNTVIMALVPVLLFSMFNAGYQHFSAINGFPTDFSVMETLSDLGQFLDRYY